MKTFLQIAKEISYKTNSELSTITTIADVDSEQLAAINDALRVLWNAEKWDFREDSSTFNTVIGQKYYTWINDIQQNGLIIDSTSLKFKNLKAEPDASGNPNSYGKEKGQLRLYPTPSSIKAVTVWFYHDYPVLADDGTPKRTFTDTNDVLNIDEFLEDLAIDCIAHLSNEILNGDSSDTDYLEHKLRYLESYKLLRSADLGTLDNSTYFSI